MTIYIVTDDETLHVLCAIKRVNEVENRNSRTCATRII